MKSKDILNDIITRNVEDLIVRSELEKKLKGRSKLRIKLGIDPTGSRIHIGRAVTLWKLRQLQDLGHTITLIVGSFTAQIGDTSDKDSERPMLSSKQVEENLKTYFDQMGKILDLSKCEKHHNSKWLGQLTYREICEQAEIGRAHV